MLRGVDEDHAIAPAVRSRLKEEGCIVDDDAARGGNPAPHLPADQGVDDPVEALRGGLRRESLSGERVAIQPPAAQDAGSPFTGQAPADVPALKDAVADRVGVDDLCSPLPKERGNHAFAAADAPGETDHVAFHG